MDTLCFAEFLYLHYLMSKSLESGNDCQSVILDDGLVEMNHAKSNFWKVIPPISWKSKLKCRRAKEAKAQQSVEQYAYHLLF